MTAPDIVRASAAATGTSVRCRRTVQRLGGQTLQRSARQILLWRALLLTAVIPALTACDRILPQRADLDLPDVATVATFYDRHDFDANFRFSGNVLEIVVQQSPDHLRRGGALWARTGPYIYLLTPGTRDVLEQYHGIAGVRAITMAGDVEVARALLLRDTLNELTWRRAINVLGTALEHGTQRPATMDALARLGEEITTYQYNPDYVPPRGR
jgi:hypothetical protein